MIEIYVLNVLIGTLLHGAFAQNSSSSAAYSLKANYSGIRFFDHFDFFHQPDPTNGYVKYVDVTTANNSKLAGFLPKSDGSLAAYMGVDSTNQISQSGRPAVRIFSKETFNHALVIADILHMPASICGMWPAYWLLGTGQDWPKAGEIDILENVNDANYNRYTLHTTEGVNLANYTSSMKGIMSTSNCNVNAPGQGQNEGCSISDSAATKSYGDAFNEGGGGIFATEIDSSGISIWFFDRSHVPADIAQDQPNPLSQGNGNASPWGLPNARFIGDGVDFDGHFQNLQIIFNTALCGDWAGQVWSSNAECSKVAPICEQYVANNPGAFTDAYWAINSVKIYQKSQSQYGTPKQGTKY